MREYTLLSGLLGGGAVVVVAGLSPFSVFFLAIGGISDEER